MTDLTCKDWVVLVSLTSLGMSAGWPDWAKFCHLGYFLKTKAIFGQNKLRGGIILENFCLKQNFYIFTIISSVKAWLVVAILRVQMWYDVIFLNFKLSFDGDILAFWLGQCFGYFFQNFGTFFHNLWVTLHVIHLVSSLTVNIKEIKYWIWFQNHWHFP